MNNVEKLGQLLTKNIKHFFLGQMRVFTIEGNRHTGSILIFQSSGGEVLRDEQVELPKRPIEDWEYKFNKGLVFLIANAYPKKGDREANENQVATRALNLFRGLAVAAGYSADNVHMTYPGPLAGRNIHFTESLSNDPYFYALIQRNIKEVEKALKYDHQ